VGKEEEEEEERERERERERDMAARVEEVPNEERGGTVGMQTPPESLGMHA
jgi:hypothetical protein